MSDTATDKTAGFTPDSLERTLRTANAHITRINKLTGWSWRFAWIEGALWPIQWVARRAAGDDWEMTGCGTAILACLFLAALVSVTLDAWRAMMIRGTSRTLLEVSWAKDKRAIPPLVSALGLTKNPVRLSVESALAQMLPLLTPEDRGLFNDRLLGTLASALAASVRDTASPNYSPGLARAILKALTAVGDMSSLTAVRKLYDNPMRAGIVEAQECIAVLTEREERERESRVLLRASDTPGETLLKPAGASDESVAAMLVRPAGTFQGGDRVN